MSSTPALTIRPYAPGDDGAILESFNRVFAATDPSFTARSEAEWRWRYLDNPAGRRIEVAVDGRGAILAQYAGLPQRARVEGERTFLTQGVDSMSAIETRGLSRTTLFVRTGEAFVREYCGPLGGGDPFVWGFPVPSARRIGERRLGYTTMRSQNALILEAGGDSIPGSPFTVEERKEVGREFTTLFREFTGRFEAIGDRSAEALRWRYLDHPTRKYRVGTLRDPATPGPAGLIGYAVYRAGSFFGRRAGLLCDWLVRPEARAPLASWAAGLAAADGDLPLIAVVPPWCEEFSVLQDFGFRVRPTPLLLAGRSFDKRWDLRFWSKGWYYTLGDSDLC